METKLFLEMSKKVSYLKPLANLPQETRVKSVQFIPRSKDDSDSAGMEHISSILKPDAQADVLVGIMSSKNEIHVGSFAEKVSTMLLNIKATLVFVSTGLGSLLAIKDKKEVGCLKTAASVSHTVLKSHLIPKIETAIDQQQKITHMALSEQIAELFATPEKISAKLQPKHVDSCYQPIIESGGRYDLNPATSSDQELLHPGVILLRLGAKYKSYCSNVGRTLLIDPTKSQERNYKILLSGQAKAIEALIPGAELRQVYEAFYKYVESQDAALCTHIPKSIGFGLGLEFREAIYSITRKNVNVVAKGMVFNVSVGFEHLQLPEEEQKEYLMDSAELERRSTYSLLLADTVLVDEATEVLTKTAKDASEITYNIKGQVNEEDNLAEEIKELEADAILDGKRSSRSRQIKAVTTVSDEKRMLEHQAALAKQKLEEAKRRYSGKDQIHVKDKDTTAEPRDLTAYSSVASFPTGVSSQRILVDMDNESMLLPIYGISVPFHISTVKSISRADDQLRINFVRPQNTAKPGLANLAEKAFPKYVFVKEAIYQVADAKHLSNLERMVKDLKKRAAQREKTNREIKTLKKQDKLVLRRGDNPRLSGLLVKPKLPGKKVTGTLEAHVNGLRFTSTKGHKFDLLYNNIKEAFFQPAEKSPVVILHFHLYDAIMLEKKKTTDVQFYQEVSESSTRIDHRGGHGDEMWEEERERKYLKKMNTTFHKFTKLVEKSAGENVIEFDIPYKEQGFFGVPRKTTVFLQPTVRCLVHLVEGPPWFILCIEDVEIAHFERVNFNLRSFDLVFIFKDYTRPVEAISSIPIDNLEDIKQWVRPPAKSPMKYSPKTNFLLSNIL